MAARIEQVPAFSSRLVIAREKLDEDYADGYAIRNVVVVMKAYSNSGLWFSLQGG